MKFFVTGGTGFVGSHLVRELEEAGHEAVVFHRKGSDLAALAGRRCRFVAGDLSSADDLARAMEGVDGVFHVAASTSWYRQDYPSVLSTNVGGTKVVLEALKKAGVRRAILTSSVAAIGYTDDPARPADESTAFNWPAWTPYPVSKRDSEALWLAATADGVETIAVNPPTVFGPGDARLSVAVLFQQVKARKMPRIPRGGFTISDVRDVAKGHLAAFEKGRPGERYILGGPDVTNAEFPDRLAGILGVRPTWLRAPVAFARSLGFALKHLETVGVRAEAAAAHVWCATRWLYHSSARAARDLGYSPRPLDEILADSAAWYRQHGHL